MAATVAPTQASSAARPDPLAPLTAFYDLLTGFPFVEVLYADRHEDGFDVWLIVDRTSAEDRERIYDAEAVIMQQFDVGLDVRIVERDSRPLSDVISLDHARSMMRFR